MQGFGDVPANDNGRYSVLWLAVCIVLAGLAFWVALAAVIVRISR